MRELILFKADWRYLNEPIYRRPTLGTNVVDWMCVHTCFPIGRQTTQHVHPSSDATRSDNCWSCNQLRILRPTASDDTRGIRCKGVVELNDIQLEAGAGSKKRLHTPVDSTRILCWYCPSKGYPKKPIAKLSADASIRSLEFEQR